jgi:hypothetical protein
MPSEAKLVSSRAKQLLNVVQSEIEFQKRRFPELFAEYGVMVQLDPYLGNYSFTKEDTAVLEVRNAYIQEGWNVEYGESWLDESPYENGPYLRFWRPKREYRKPAIGEPKETKKQRQPIKLRII